MSRMARIAPLGHVFHVSEDGIRGEMDRRLIYGDKTLIAKISKEYKVEEVTRMQGRPKKKD